MKTIYHVAIFSLMLCAVSQVEAGLFSGKCKPAGSCDSVQCDSCRYVCCPEVKTEKVKKHCWETECKPVCIPKVRCPLFDFFRKDKCDPCTALDANGRSLSGACAEVRMVKKLKKVEYECEKCVVEWNVRLVSNGCSKGCTFDSQPGSCCRIE